MSAFRTLSWAAVGVGLATASYMAISVDRGQITPSVVPESLSSDLVTQTTDNNGRPIIRLDDSLAKNFFSEQWIQTARENLAAHALDRHMLPTWNDWQRQEQDNYRQQAVALFDRVASECNGESKYKDCQGYSPFNREVEKLQREYVPADAMRLWELQNIEKAFVASVMDHKIREAIHNWRSLSAAARLAAGKRLLTHQSQAYREVTAGKPSPILRDDYSAGSPDAMRPSGSEGYTSIDGNVIDLRLSNDAETYVANLWHEGHHRVDDKSEGKVFKNPDLDAANRARIADKDMYTYPPPPPAPSEKSAKGAWDNKYDAYTHSATEAWVRVDEAAGHMLVRVTLSKNANHRWTVQEAQESFRSMLTGVDMQYTKDIEPNTDKINMNTLARKLRYEEAMHEAFLKTYLAGGKVCEAVMTVPSYNKRDICPELRLH